MVRMASLDMVHSTCPCTISCERTRTGFTSDKQISPVTDHLYEYTNLTEHPAETSMMKQIQSHDDLRSVRRVPMIYVTNKRFGDARL